MMSRWRSATTGAGCPPTSAPASGCTRCGSARPRWAVTAGSSRSRAAAPACWPGCRGALVSEVRVLVVEDHPLFRKGVVTLLDAVDGIAVVGTAASGEEAVERVGELAPDVVLMDL